MDEWHVGDPEDWGDSVGVPDIPYMGYLNNDDEDDGKPPREPKETLEAKSLSDEAWRLEGEGRYRQALELINQAIEKFPYNANHFNRKAIILEDLNMPEEALDVYDKALSFGPDRVIQANKAGCMLSILESKRPNTFTHADLNLINEALKTLPKDENNYPYLQMKGNILEELGEPVNARICYYLSNKMYDKVDETEKELRILKSSTETFINITGTNHYQNFRPFRQGTIVDLVREPENKYDKDAIRVEINGENVGYVANSDYTLIDEVKSATEIKDMASTKAEVLFLLVETYVIAKLI